MATKLAWSEGYIVGVQSIDEQHKKLVHLIVALWDAIESGKGRTIITEVLQKLVDYTRVHFVDEERYMVDYRYPEYRKHKSQHDRFVQEVMKFTKEYVEGRSIPTVKILHFLANWLVDHILVHDKKLSTYLIDKGVK